MGGRRLSRRERAADPSAVGDRDRAVVSAPAAWPGNAAASVEQARMAASTEADLRPSHRRRRDAIIMALGRNR